MAALDALYTGGPILTLEGDSPAYAEALGVAGGRIEYVGDAAGAEALTTSDTQRVDLDGAALLPGFYDAHGHLIAAAHQREQAWLRGGDVTSIPALVRALQAKAAERPLEPGDWIVGAGWHAALLEERRPPTADELDAVSTEFPVIAIHASGHTCSVNHRALELAGFTPGCPEVEGGVIHRVEGTDIPSGYLEEAPLFTMRSMMAPVKPTRYVQLVTEAMLDWAANGFTTAQEDVLGSGAPDDMPMLAAAAEAGLMMDILVYSEPKHYAAALEAFPGSDVDYVRNVRLRGVKLFLDGSLGGQTAWITAPYAGRDSSDSGCCGVPTSSDEVLAQIFRDHYTGGVQIQAHQNGDRAVDQFLDAVEAARAEQGEVDARPIAIHAQLVRPEQWARMRDLGVVPSLYPTALSAQGDIVAQAVPDRVEWFNAARTALDAGLRFSAHNDAPLVPMSGVALLDGLVNRRTESRTPITPEQRIGMFEALKSITVWAAYQHFEDHVKGTLEVGKHADLVILDRDPLAVDPEAILDVRVMETIRRGVTIYRAER